MKITVTYEVSGEWPIHQGDLLKHLERGPLRTGLDAANRQLADEGKKLRLRLVDIKVE